MQRRSQRQHFSSCGGCQTVSYFDADVKRSHWKVHKKIYIATAAPAQAACWNHISADAGHINAQVNLGTCYANGIGVAQDYKEAARLVVCFILQLRQPRGKL